MHLLPGGGFALGGGNSVLHRAKPLKLVLKRQPIERLGDRILNLCVLPLRLHRQRFRRLAPNLFFLTLDRDLDLFDRLDGLVKTRLKLGQHRVGVHLLPHQLGRQFAVPLLEGHRRLSLVLRRLLLLLVQHQLQPILLRNRLNRLLAVAGERRLHVSLCLIQHDFRILNLIHRTVKQTAQPIDKSLHESSSPACVRLRPL